MHIWISCANGEQVQPYRPRSIGPLVLRLHHDVEASESSSAEIGAGRYAVSAKLQKLGRISTSGLNLSAVCPMIRTNLAWITGNQTIETEGLTFRSGSH
jgi:hypothetical protein